MTGTIEVPPALRAFVAGRSWTELARYPSAPNRVFALSDGRGADLVLKVGADLRGEASRLEWLAQQDASGIEVPALVGFVERHQGQGLDYLMTTRLTGRDGGDLDVLARPEAVVVALAGALRTLHATPTSGCPFSADVNDLLAMADHRVETGAVSPSDFPPAYLGQPPRALLDRLRELRPTDGDDDKRVLTHGDPSLVNFLFRDGVLTGMLDVGLLGVSDPFRDLAIAMRTVGTNIGSRWQPLLLEAYGEAYDARRLSFFLLLDRFVMARG